LSGKRRARYKDRGYAYLDLEKSKTREGKVVFSLVDSGTGQAKDSEWKNTAVKGEFEVVGLETEDMKAATVRFDKGSQTLEWQRNQGGKLTSLVATADAMTFERPITG